MTAADLSTDPAVPERIGLLPRILRTAEDEARRFASDPALRDALARESRLGARIAWNARIVATAVIAALLPFLNPTWGVLYYEAMLLVFLGIGWLRLRAASVGRSFYELLLILADILFLLFVTVVPNPFLENQMPTTFGFRFGNFQYFFVILALATLAHSWRTVWTIGIIIAVLWMATAGLVALVGKEVPYLSLAVRSVAAWDPDLTPFVDLNDVQWNLRLQEAVIFVIVAGALTLKGWRSNQLLIRQARLAEERANLSRYFAPTVVDALAAGAEDLGAPRRREVAVMFVDIVGFTALAERHSDEAVLGLLRRYYAEIERIVFDHGGTLDKYLGDGVMATFGTLHPGAGDAANAVLAARRIVAAVDAMGDWSEGQRAPVVSVGVHFGAATVGDVGPARRLEFAVIGDTVNVASRLEAATRELGARIVCSDALMARAGTEAQEGFQRRAGLILRGRAAPIDVWTHPGAVQAAG